MTISLYHILALSLECFTIGVSFPTVSVVMNFSSLHGEMINLPHSTDEIFGALYIEDLPFAASPSALPSITTITLVLALHFNFADFFISSRPIT
jgi:hypothetical protein